MLQEVQEKRIILYYKNIESNDRVRIMISKPSTYEQLLKKIYLTLEINPKEYHVDMYIFPSNAIIFPGNYYLVRDSDIIQLELEPIKNKRIITESGNEERKRTKKSVDTTVNNKNKEKEDKRITIDVDESAHEVTTINSKAHQEMPKEIAQKEIPRPVIIQQQKNEKEDELDKLEKELEKELKDLQERNKERLDERSMNILTDSQLDYASLTPPHVEEMETKLEKRREKNARKVIDINKTPPRAEKILDTPQNSPQRTEMIVENSPVVVTSSKKKPTNNKRKKSEEEEDENWEPSQDGELFLGRKESEEEEEEEIVKESPPKKIKQTPKTPAKTKTNKNTKTLNISSNKDTKTNTASKRIVADNTKKNRVIETEDSPIKKNPSTAQHDQHFSSHKKHSNKKVKFSVKLDDDDDYIDSSSFEESDTGHYYPPLIDENSSEKEPKHRHDKSSSDDYHSPAKISNAQKNVLFVDDVSRDDQQDYDSSSPIRETKISDFCKKDVSSLKSPTKFVQQRITSKSPSPSKSIWTREDLMKKVHFSTWSELREIAKKLGVKAKGTKDDLRQKLLRRIKYSI